jgi:uncharacterized protein (TIGR02266 family)
MSYSGEDLRAHPRIPLILQVEYPEREGYLADATENLSAGGAFVRTDRPLALGDRIPLVLSFANLLEPLEVLGVVAWVRPAREGMPAGVGIRIPEDRPADREKLQKILTRPKQAPAPASGYRVLLVEDNPHIMELYEYVMKKLSRSDGVALEVALARDGFDALERLSRERFDLVVTDLYMPVLDGFEFIRKLREDPRSREIPVVAISAGGADAQAQARQAGATVFLRKPVRFVDVVETVRMLLKL